MRIYAVRHAQAEHNARWRLNDDPAHPSDLTKKGRAQASTVAKKLRQTKFDRIYTSQFPRTQQTAAIINKYHNVPIVIEARLNEVRTGYGGLPVWRWLLAQVVSGFRTSKRHRNGESLDEARQRIKGWLAELRQGTDQEVLIVAHQHTLQTLISVIRDVSYAKSLKHPIGHTQILEFDLA